MLLTFLLVVPCALYRVSSEPGSETQHVVAELSIKQGEGVFCLTGKLNMVMACSCVEFWRSSGLVWAHRVSIFEASPAVPALPTIHPHSFFFVYIEWKLPGKVLICVGTGTFWPTGAAASAASPRTGRLIILSIKHSKVQER